MKSLFLSIKLLAVLAYLVPLQAEEQECSDGSIGYLSIASINEDIKKEARLVAIGKHKTQSLYNYRLCPNTVFKFTGNESLIPIFPRSKFTCGDSGLLRENCTFLGGQVQVSLLQYDPPLDVIELCGIRFSDFQEAAIAGDADSWTSLLLSDTEFINFDTPIAVNRIAVNRIGQTGSLFHVRTLKGHASYAESSSTLNDSESQYIDNTSRPSRVRSEKPTKPPRMANNDISTERPTKFPRTTNDKTFMPSKPVRTARPSKVPGSLTSNETQDRPQNERTSRPSRSLRVRSARPTRLPQIANNEMSMPAVAQPVKPSKPVRTAQPSKLPGSLTSNETQEKPQNGRTSRPSRSLRVRSARPTRLPQIATNKKSMPSNARTIKPSKPVRTARPSKLPGSLASNVTLGKTQNGRTSRPSRPARVRSARPTRLPRTTINKSPALSDVRSVKPSRPIRTSRPSKLHTSTGNLFQPISHQYEKFSRHPQVFTESPVDHGIRPVLSHHPSIDLPKNYKISLEPSAFLKASLDPSAASQVSLAPAYSMNVVELTYAPSFNAGKFFVSVDLKPEVLPTSPQVQSLRPSVSPTKHPKVQTKAPTRIVNSYSPVLSTQKPSVLVKVEISVIDLPTVVGQFPTSPTSGRRKKTSRPTSFDTSVEHINLFGHKTTIDSAPPTSGKKNFPITNRKERTTEPSILPTLLISTLSRQPVKFQKQETGRSLVPHLSALNPSSPTANGKRQGQSSVSPDRGQVNRIDTFVPTKPIDESSSPVQNLDSKAPKAPRPTQVDSSKPTESQRGPQNAKGKIFIDLSPVQSKMSQEILRNYEVKLASFLSETLGAVDNVSVDVVRQSLVSSPDSFPSLRSSFEQVIRSTVLVKANLRGDGRPDFDQILVTTINKHKEVLLRMLKNSTNEPSKKYFASVQDVAAKLITVLSRSRPNCKCPDVKGSKLAVIHGGSSFFFDSDNTGSGIAEPGPKAPPGPKKIKEPTYENNNLFNTRLLKAGKSTFKGNIRRCDCNSPSETIGRVSDVELRKNEMDASWQGRWNWEKEVKHAPLPLPAVKAGGNTVNHEGGGIF